MGTRRPGRMAEGNWRLPIVAAWLVVAAGMAITPALAHAHSTGRVDARAEFSRAIRLAARSGRLHFNERFDYASSAATGIYGMQVLRGGRVRASWSLEERANHGFRNVEGPFKSGGTASDALVQALVLNLLIPGISRTPAHPAIHLLLLEQYRVTGISFSVQSRLSSTIIAVRGRGYPWQCALACGAAPYIPQARISEEYTYAGRLVVDARSGLPRQYTSSRTLLGRTSPGQSASFTYPPR